MTRLPVLRILAWIGLIVSLLFSLVHWGAVCESSWLLIGPYAYVIRKLEFRAIGGLLAALVFALLLVRERVSKSRLTRVSGA